MIEIFDNHVLLLFLQCLVAATLLLALYRLRTIFGMIPFYISLGLFKYMHFFITKSFAVEIVSGVNISMGSSVLFTLILYSILLIYILEDALKARQIIYALVIANFVFTFIQMAIGWGFGGNGFINYYNIPHSFFDLNLRLVATGTLLIFIDSFLIIFIYEQISRFVRNQFLQIALTMAIVFSVHVFLIAFGAFSGTARFYPALISGFVSKIIPLIAYSIIFWFYLVFIEKRLDIGKHQSGDFKDVFNLLTYRQKYELIYKEKEAHRLAHQESEMKYHALFKSNQAAILILDPWSGAIIDANPSACKFYGWSLDELKSKFLKDINIGDEIDIKISMELVRAGRQEQFFSRHQLANGDIRDVEIYGGSIHMEGQSFLYSIIHDITQRKIDELALLASESKLIEAQRLAKIGDFTWDVVTGEVVWSDGMYDLLGYDKTDKIDLSKVNAAIHHPDDLERVTRWLSDCLASEKYNLSPNEYRLVRRDGKVIDVHTEGNILYQDGKAVTVFGMCKDITESNLAKAELTSMHSRLTHTLENMTDGFVSLDTNWIYTYANKQAAEMFGRKPEDLVGKHIWTEFPEGIDQPFYKNYYKAVKTQIPILFEDYYPPWERWYENRVIPSIDGLAIFFQDITERKIADIRLKESEDRYRSIVENSFEGIGMINDSFRFTYANKNLAILFGYPMEKVIGEDFRKFLSPESLEIVSERYSRRQKGENILQRYEITLKQKTEGKRIAELASSIIINKEGKPQTIVQLIDITDRKQAREALILSNEHYQTLFDESPVPLWEEEFSGLLAYIEKHKESGISDFRKWFDDHPEELSICAQKVIIKDVNQATLHLHDTKSKEELLGNLDKIFTPNSLNVFKEEILAIISGQLEFESEAEVKTLSGEVRYIFLKINIESDQKGMIRAILATSDITARKQSEADLKKYANRLHILHDIDSAILSAKSTKSIADGVLLELQRFIDLKFASVVEFDQMNQLAIPVAGLPEDLFQEMKSHKLLITEYEFIDLARLEKGQIQIVKDLKKKKTKSKRVEKMLADNISSVINIPLFAEDELMGMLSLGGESFHVFSPDKIEIASEIASQLTVSMRQWKLREEIMSYTEELEEKVAERTEQLEHSNRELRDFAQIVSHDLKAPLRAISQLSYWISQDYADKLDDEGQKQLSLLIGRVKRLDDLIEGILQYSRAGKTRDKEIPINLNDLVDKNIQSLSPPDSIHISIENTLPEYTGDPTRLGQIFQNLIDNAIKYMDKPTGSIKVGCTQEAEFWKFYVTDNGPGIEEKYYDRIFQIFQRLVARDELEGTGMGLSLVKRIIQIYGGQIWVESKPGEGATFYFTLPLQNNPLK